MERGEWDEEGDGERNGRQKGVLERGGVGDVWNINEMAGVSSHGRSLH